MITFHDNNVFCPNAYLALLWRFGHFPISPGPRRSPVRPPFLDQLLRLASFAMSLGAFSKSWPRLETGAIRSPREIVEIPPYLLCNQHVSSPRCEYQWTRRWKT